MSLFEEPHFKDADKAREYLERLRWGDTPICPHCGVIGKHWALTAKADSKKPGRAGLWKCSACRKQFSVTVGTVFERSKIALNVWLQAVFLLCSSKKGMSAHQLQRMLDVQYKTAWFMAHRIREAMKPGAGGILGGSGSSGIVEADETYWGNNQKGYRSGKYVGRPGDTKMKIFSLVKMMFTQCSICGCVVGTSGFFDAGVLAKNNKEKLDELERKIDSIEHYVAQFAQMLSRSR